jgi:hypothetical protein
MAQALAVRIDRVMARTLSMIIETRAGVIT